MRTEQEKTNRQKITDFADKSLLIVDDDKRLRELLESYLVEKNFKVFLLIKVISSSRHAV